MDRYSVSLSTCLFLRVCLSRSPLWSWDSSPPPTTIAIGLKVVNLHVSCKFLNFSFCSYSISVCADFSLAWPTTSRSWLQTTDCSTWLQSLAMQKAVKDQSSLCNCSLSLHLGQLTRCFWGISQCQNLLPDFDEHYSPHEGWQQCSHFSRSRYKREHITVFPQLKARTLGQKETPQTKRLPVVSIAYQERYLLKPNRSSTISR